jgi:tetratricopeptide (TPR) repeat protein/tRNA A-37 threonylcarbamoyl transferase component Bud32
MLVSVNESFPTIEEFEAFIETGRASARLQGLLEAGDSACLDQLERMRGNNALLDELMAAGPGDEIDAAEALVGETIGGYRIKRVIAAGGMGVVYEAQQEQPRRVVALKVMRAGLASRSALRRFEYEAQLLARLRHPGVAQVFEAGTHDDGRARVPWFAMEYIPGARDLVSYADHKKLSTDQRLALMSLVCEAVQHGHQKGIIHRDLKPANILVDTNGQPKVIDFGVARATDSDLALTAMQTDVGQLIGTLQYMSPEQCEADPHDLDVRSDVYALGVVLYEMLTGELPYKVSQKSVVEGARAICEEPARRPSTVNVLVRGDIETIVLMALEKDRERRYQSLGELSADIGRYLRREAIEARRATVVYRTVCFARRNWGVVAAVAGLIVVLSGALVVTTNSLGKTNVALGREKGIAAEARQYQDIINEMLSMAGAKGTDGGDITVVEVFGNAAERFDERFAGDINREAAARNVLGTTFLALGRFDEAEIHLRRAMEILQLAVGIEDPAYAGCLSNLGALERRRGNHGEAIDLFKQALEIYRARYGDRHMYVADNLNNLGATYSARYRDAEQNEKGSGDQSDLEDAERLYEQASEIYLAEGGGEWVAQIKNNHGGMLAQVGEYERAERYLREALDTRRRMYGRSHRKVASSANNLGRLYFITGRYEESEPLLRDALTIRRAVFGEEHVKAAESAVAYALVLVEIGEERWDEARELIQGAIGVLERNGSSRAAMGRAALVRLHGG